MRPATDPNSVYQRVDNDVYTLVELLAMSTTIRVSEETRDRLASLASATGRPMTRVLEDAVEALERRIFFEAFNRRYQQLRDDPEAWAEIDHERRTE
jgi:predicted transcriptional regulator